MATTAPRCRIAPHLPAPQPSRRRPMATTPPRCRIARDLPAPPALAATPDGDNRPAMPHRTPLLAICPRLTGAARSRRDARWRQPPRDAASHTTYRHLHAASRLQPPSPRRPMAITPSRCRIARGFSPSARDLSPPAALAARPDGDNRPAMPHRTPLTGAGRPRGDARWRQPPRDAASRATYRHLPATYRLQPPSPHRPMAITPSRCRIARGFSPSARDLSPPAALAASPDGDNPPAMPHRTPLSGAARPRRIARWR